MTGEEVMNPTEYQNPDYAKTNLDIVKEQHPGMSDAHGRLIVNAQNHRDSVKERLAGKKEALEAKRENLYKAYLDQYDNAETEEEKAARQRRETKAQRWAAVGDAISALANIGGAMGGATPIKPSKTLSGAQAERMEYARKLRELEQKKRGEKNKARYEQAKKDFDETKKEYDNAVKSVANAEKNIQEQEYRAMTLQNTDRTQERNDKKEQRADEHNAFQEAMAQKNYELAVARARNQQEYQAASLALRAASVNNAAHKGSDTKMSDIWYNLGQSSRAAFPDQYNEWVAKNRSTVRGMSDDQRLRAYGAAVQAGYGKQTPKITPKQPVGGGSKPKTATSSGSLLPGGKQQVKTTPKQPATGGGSLLPKKK